MIKRSETCNSLLQFGFLEFLGVLGHNEMIDAVLDVTVHKGGQIVDGITDTVVGDAPLGIVVSADFGRAVTCRDKRLAPGGNVVLVLLMLVVIDEGAHPVAHPC